MATSTITNTITDPTGVAVAAVPVTILLVAALATGQAPGAVGASRISDGSEVAPEVTVTTNASGVWTAALEQNANITPANTFYVAVEVIPASAGGIRTWSFAVGAANQTLQAALVSTPPTGVLSSYLTQAAADARYVASPGSFSGTVQPVSNGVAANSGAAASYSRGDHVHNYLDNFQCSVYRNAALNVPSGANTPIVFDTVREDPQSMYNTGTGTFTAPVAGRYLICGALLWNNTAVANTVGFTQIGSPAGTTEVRRGVQQLLQVNVNVGTAVAAIVRLAASGTFSLNGFQNTGGALALVVTGTQLNYCDVQLLGP